MVEKTKFSLTVYLLWFQILIFEQHKVSGETICLDQEPSLGEITLTVIQKTIVPADIKATIMVLKAATWMGPWAWKALKLFIK